MELLKIADVAKLLKVSAPTIYNWMARNHNPIPHYKQAGTTRFDKDEVIQWFKGER